MKNLFILFIFVAIQSFGQSTTTGDEYPPVNQNRVPIIGAFQSLNMIYDARSGGMGDAGVAISPDENSAYMNAAKLSFLTAQTDSTTSENDSLKSKKNKGISISYTPWESKLINDMGLYGLTAYTTNHKNDAFSLTLKYFDLGTLNMRDDNGVSMGSFSSKEFSFMGTYSKRITNHSSLGVGMKFIHSDLFGKQTISGMSTKPVSAIAGDINYFYNGNPDNRKTNWLNIGAVMQNIGGKVAYGDFRKRSFQPTILRVGLAENFTFGSDRENTFTFTTDASKLLVPTPAIRDAKNNVLKGKNEEDISALGAIFQSWGSAPNGFSETMQEIMYSFGAEVTLKRMLSLRGGYHTENKNKSDIHFFTLGVGLKVKTLGFNFSYLIPTTGASPLANTWRFTLLYNTSKK